MRLFALILFCCYHIALSAQNPTEKLVAFFPFGNCKGVDDSGNGSSGALIDNVGCVCGVRDSALTFDGDDDAIYFVGPLSDVFTSSDFSVSFYFKPTPVGPNEGGSQVLLSKQENCNTQRAFWVRFNPKSKKISSGISQNDTLFVTVTADLNPDACWQYVTLVRSNTNYSIYIDGELRDSRNTPARVDISSNAVLKVGEPICTLDRGYKGDLDELRIYSRALKPDDINVLDLKPDKILNGDTLLYLGNSMQMVTSQTCAQNFQWSPADGSLSDTGIPNPVATPTQTTTYEVKFLYSGCTASDTVLVNVIDPDTLDCSQIFIPNAFTPSASSGRNDFFGISNPYNVDEFISFEVFDRWGGRVFSAATALDTWDGTFQGKAMNPGVYLYRLRYRCNGEEKVNAGSLTLLR